MSSVDLDEALEYAQDAKAHIDKGGEAFKTCIYRFVEDVEAIVRECKKLRDHARDLELICANVPTALALWEAVQCFAAGNGYLDCPAPDNEQREAYKKLIALAYSGEAAFKEDKELLKALGRSELVTLGKVQSRLTALQGAVEREIAEAPCQRILPGYGEKCERPHSKHEIASEDYTPPAWATALSAALSKSKTKEEA